jgi:myosin heavy subunit
VHIVSASFPTDPPAFLWFQPGFCFLPGLPQCDILKTPFDSSYLCSFAILSPIDARAARALRDELDIQRERANKVHLLETELQSYKDKMSQMESLKCRIEEVREENKILVETKEMLEDQLESSRKRCAQIMSIEQELFKYKAELHNCQLESENDKKRIEELEAENIQLQMSSKSSISESQSILAEMENIRNRGGQTDTNILTEQLGEGMS